MVLEVKKLMGTKRGRDVQVESAEICTLTHHTSVQGGLDLYALVNIVFVVALA